MSLSSPTGTPFNHRANSKQRLEHFRRRWFADALIEQLQPKPSKDFRVAWQWPEVRQWVEQSITGGNFKHHPQAARIFFEALATEAAKPITTPFKAFYRKLARVFKRLKSKLELPNSFTEERKHRVERRVRQVERLLEEYKPSQYLDIGCGRGDMTEAIQKRYGLSQSQVVGLEVVAPENPPATFEVKTYDGVQLPIKTNSQDLVTLFAVLHHTKQTQTVLNEAFRVLKPGGKLIVREFHAKTPSEKHFQQVMDELFYRVYTHAPDVPIPGHYFSKSTWYAMARQAGFFVQTELIDEPKNPYQPFMALLHKPEPNDIIIYNDIKTLEPKE